MPVEEPVNRYEHTVVVAVSGTVPVSSIVLVDLASTGTHGRNIEGPLLYCTYRGQGADRTSAAAAFAAARAAAAIARADGTPPFYRHSRRSVKGRPSERTFWNVKCHVADSSTFSGLGVIFDVRKGVSQRLPFGYSRRPVGFA